MDLAGKHSRTGKLYRTLGNSDSGLSFQVPSSELSAALNKGTSETLQEKEREQIMRALRECNGQPGGPGGAAARLGLKRTTLQSRLIHFGIDPGGYRGQPVGKSD